MACCNLLACVLFSFFSLLPLNNSSKVITAEIYCLNPSAYITLVMNDISYPRALLMDQKVGIH